MKKRLLALLLAGAMVMGLSMTAMAATTKHFSNQATLNDANENAISLEADKDVPFADSGLVKIDVDPNEATAVYYVTVEWDDLTFGYSFGNAPVWNPIEHSYTDVNNNAWDKTQANIKVTNHSNRAMDVTASFSNTEIKDAKTENDVQATLDKTQDDLANGEGRTFAGADFATFVVSVSGTPNTTLDFDLGTVYLNISDATPVTP